MCPLVHVLACPTQAEALAKTYGRKQLFNRFASEMLSLMTNQARLYV